MINETPWVVKSFSQKSTDFTSEDNDSITMGCQAILTFRVLQKEITVLKRGNIFSILEL